MLSIGRKTQKCKEVHCDKLLQTARIASRPGELGYKMYYSMYDNGTLGEI